MLILCQRFFWKRCPNRDDRSIRLRVGSKAPRAMRLKIQDYVTWQPIWVGSNGASTELGWGWMSWILRCQEAIFRDCFPDVSMAIMIEHVWSLGKKHLEQIWRLEALGAQLTFLFWNLGIASWKGGNKIKQRSISCFHVAPLSRICDGSPNLKCL